MEQQRQYVGIDLHRKRSVIVRRNAAGETVETVRIDNDPRTLASELAKAGEHPEVVLEATYGWYWAVDVLEECGASVHLAHPLGNNWGQRRVKNDERDATDLVDLSRLGRLAEAWIAPPPLREYIRYRAKLVHQRTSLKAQVHSVLAKEGLFGVRGHALMNEVHLGDAYRVRVESLGDLTEACDREITMLEEHIAPILAGDLGYQSDQTIPGVGPILASIFVAEIGDISRFSSARHLCSWAGLTPTHRGSTTRSAGATSPSKGHASCAGQPSRPWPVSAQTPRSGLTTAVWASGGASRSDGWRPPANFSCSSTTACVTARSVAWPRRSENRNGRNPLRARGLPGPRTSARPPF